MAEVTGLMSNQTFNENSLLHVATLGRSVGLKGDMKLHSTTDFSHQFKKNAIFLIDKDISVTLDSVDLKKGTVRITGYDTPEACKKLVNKKLFVTVKESREACALKENEFFWFDIIGCFVYESDVLLGKVHDIERIGSTDYLHIATDDILINEEGAAKFFLVPYIDQFVLDAKPAEKKIWLQGAKDILEAS